MSRSGLIDADDCDPLDLARYRSAVSNAIRGKRGQAFLRELLTEMDAMPTKRLISGAWETPVGGLPFAPTGGDVCAIGVMTRARKLDMSDEDPDDDEVVRWAAEQLNIAHAMAADLVWENDECSPHGETPEQRWVRMRRLVAVQLVGTPERAEVERVREQRRRERAERREAMLDLKVELAQKKKDSGA